MDADPAVDVVRRWAVANPPTVVDAIRAYVAVVVDMVEGGPPFYSRYPTYIRLLGSVVHDLDELDPEWERRPELDGAIHDQLVSLGIL